MRALKIVVTGPFGAGKTTLIKTISEVAVVSTEREISSGVAKNKRETTVAMDFGRITLDGGLVLYLFGTPGQERFDFMWEILAEGMLGFVLVVDCMRQESLEESRKILRAFESFGEASCVVGVNKTEEMGAEAAVSWVREALALPESMPAIALDARDRDSVKNLLLSLLTVVLEDMERQEAAAG